MSEKFIHINFNLIENIDDDLKLLFKNRVLSVIKKKFEGTDVEIITELDDALLLLQHGQDVKTVVIHDQLKHNVTNAIGEAYPGGKVSYVNIESISASDLSELSEKAGLISSHELGHLFLGNHSIGVNLMSEGNVIDAVMNSENRMELSFTKLQKQLIKNGKPEGLLLSDIENQEAASSSVSDFLENLFEDFGL